MHFIFNDCAVDTVLKHLFEQYLASLRQFIVLYMYRQMLENIPFNVYQWREDTQQCQSLRPTVFLPNEKDWEVLKDRMVFLVQRIVVHQMVWFRKTKVEHHVKHQFTEKMSQKTDVVNLGILNDHPASHEGG